MRGIRRFGEASIWHRLSAIIYSPSMVLFTATEPWEDDEAQLTAGKLVIDTNLTSLLN